MTKEDPKHLDFFISCAWFLMVQVFNHTAIVILETCLYYRHLLTQFTSLKKKGKGVLDWLKLPPWKTESNFSDTSIVLSTWLGFFCMLNLIVLFCFIL